jgi:hypothetical protein
MKKNDGKCRNSIFRVDIAVLAGQEGPLFCLNLFQGSVNLYEQYFGSGLANIFHTMRVSRYNR